MKLLFKAAGKISRKKQSVPDGSIVAYRQRKRLVVGQVVAWFGSKSMRDKAYRIRLLFYVSKDGKLETLPFNLVYDQIDGKDIESILQVGA